MLFETRRPVLYSMSVVLAAPTQRHTSPGQTESDVVIQAWYSIKMVFKGEKRQGSKGRAPCGCQGQAPPGLKLLHLQQFRGISKLLLPGNFDS